MRGRFGASFAIRHGEISPLIDCLERLSKQSCRRFNMQNRNSAWCDIEDTRLLYRVPENVTRGRFPDGGESDSTWRTQEARHVGSHTIAPGFPAVHGVVRWR